MTNCVLYLRFSPRRNAADCESCEVQEHYCREYASKHGLAVKAVFRDEAQSGADEDRPGLWAAVEALGRGWVLLAWKRDRLARDVYLAEVIRRAVEKAGASIVAADGGGNGDSPEQVMIRQVLAAFSEYERRVIGLRTKYAMLRHQAAGRRMSAQPPYGWTCDGARLVPCDAERAAVLRAVELRAAGKGFRAIARTLRQEGHVSRGAVWDHKTLRRVLDRQTRFPLVESAGCSPAPVPLPRQPVVESEAGPSSP